MSFVRRLGAASFVLSAVVAASGVITATPASAGVNCSSGYHCLFYSTVDSSKHQFFNSDTNFADNTFSGGNGIGAGQTVNNNSWAASNSSTGGYESHYYDGTGYTGAFLFCVNPGATVRSIPSALRDRASSLRLRGTTSISCISN